MDEPKQAKRRRFRWTDKNTVQFLDVLAATCNVRAAARAVGVSDACVVYTRRRRDPAFVAAWGEALALGYQMLETLLVGHALAGGADGEPMEDGSEGGSAVNVELALKLLKDHRDRPGKPQGGRPRRIARPEDTNRVLLHKLEMLEKAKRLRAEGPPPIALPAPANGPGHTGEGA
jgi:hypothetical protein